MFLNFDSTKKKKEYVMIIRMIYLTNDVPKIPNSCTHKLIACDPSQHNIQSIGQYFCGMPYSMSPLQS